MPRIVALLSPLLLVLPLAALSALALAHLQSLAGIDMSGRDLIPGLGIGRAEALTSLILAGTLLAEVATRGWRGSSLERMTTAPQRTHRSDLFFAIAAITALSPMIVLVGTFGICVALREAVGAWFGWRLAADWPFWLSVPATTLLADFLQYWLHRALHSDALWSLHAIHHAAADLTPLTAARNHPIDDLLTGLTTAIATLTLGAPDAAMLWAAAIVNIQAVVVHSNMPFPLWLEKTLVAGPRLHRLHHSFLRDEHDNNFGAFPIWDRLFGTYRLHIEPPTRLGVDDPRFDTGNPLRDITTATLIWFQTIGGQSRGLLRARLQPRTGADLS